MSKVCLKNVTPTSWFKSFARWREDKGVALCRRLKFELAVPPTADGFYLFTIDKNILIGLTRSFSPKNCPPFHTPASAASILVFEIAIPSFLVLHVERGTVFGLALAPVVEAGRGDIGVAQLSRGP